MDYFLFYRICFLFNQIIAHYPEYFKFFLIKTVFISNHLIFIHLLPLYFYSPITFMLFILFIYLLKYR